MASDGLARVSGLRVGQTGQLNGVTGRRHRANHIVERGLRELDGQVLREGRPVRMRRTASAKRYQVEALLAVGDRQAVQLP